VALASVDQPIQPILIGLIGLTLLVPLVGRVVRRRFDPFEPLLLFVLAYGVMFVVRPAAMIVRDDVTHRGPLHATDVSKTFTEMLVIALLGAVAFVGSYSLPFGARLGRATPAPRDAFDPGRVVAFALLVALVGMLSFAAFLWYLGGLETLGPLLRGRSIEAVADAPAYFWSGFFVVVPATLVVLAVAFQLRSKTLLAVGLALATVVLIRAVPLGERILLLPFLGGIFVYSYVRRLARPSFVTVVAVLVVALIGSSFLRDMRGRDIRGETVSESFVKIVSQPGWTLEPVLTGSEAEMAPALAAALAVIPEKLGYTYGETIFGDLVIRPVPRSLWDGKPLPPRERVISTLWPEEYERLHLNPEFSTLLYFYWDFSFIGVAIGLALYGVAARVLYEYFLRNRTNISVQVFYSLAIWFVVIAARDSPVDTFMRAVFILLPAVLIFGLATRSSTRPEKGAALDEGGRPLRAPRIT
jgi:hypothetical protein